MQIPNQLQFYRKHSGFKQSDVARHLGFASTDRISHWEQGQTFPHILNLFKLAHLYHVSPKELYPELYEDTGEMINGLGSKSPPPPE